MYAKDKEIEMLASKQSCFNVHGAGKLYFNDEKNQLRELTGEIFVVRDPGCQVIYVQISSGGKQFLMPIQSVDSIKWDKKTKE